MPGWLEQMPFAALFGVLLAASTVRGQCVYWLGRFIAYRTSQSEIGPATRLRAWATGESVARGIDTVRRWGWPAVPLAHLTVGLQTAIVVSCGIINMRWWVFSVAQIPGTLVWATIYATIGWLAWEALAWAAITSPWAVALAVIAVVAVTVLVVIRAKHRANHPASRP